MGTRARIATVCMTGAYQRSAEENRRYVYDLLDVALKDGPDMVCLPEAFATTPTPDGGVERTAEPVPGPTTDHVARRAREHSCYVICPLNTRRDGRCWNSAVLIGRTGEIVGIYDKMQPVVSSSDYTAFEHGTTPGTDVGIFDLDFGRIGMQICFDIGFPRNWQKFARQGARIVFWPSAYDGGLPLRAYAVLHGYYVVSSVRAERSRIIDPCGQTLAETGPTAAVVYRDVNLDYVVCHYDFNYSIPDLIMKAYPGKVEVRSHHTDGRFVVEPTHESITTETLRRQFGFESMQQYYHRHERAYKRLRSGREARPQSAAHGARPMYAKWHT